MPDERFIGVEIGGTKLQIAIGAGKGEPFQSSLRLNVESPRRADTIQRQIIEGIQSLLQDSQSSNTPIRGIGIGFGGPVDAARGIVVTSHQVEGWAGFQITQWLERELSIPAVLQNDADTAAFAEAAFGAGRGFNPVMYVTVGSGIGGGLIVNGRVYRGQGAGALEIGHLRPNAIRGTLLPASANVESIASGFGITARARQMLARLDTNNLSHSSPTNRLVEFCQGDSDAINTPMIVKAAQEGDEMCQALIADATETLGWALAQAITLMNPARIVIGGGVSLLGEELFFRPVREACQRYVFGPFAKCAEIVPAELGEEVVVHGALALARAAFSPTESSSESMMDDSARVQGNWRLKSGCRGGVAFPPNIIESVIISFEQDQMTTQVGERRNTFRFNLDPSQNPPAIDLDLGKATGRGIYRFDGDSLWLVHGEEGTPRPTEFTSPADSSITLMELRREST